MKHLIYLGIVIVVIAIPFTLQASDTIRYKYTDNNIGNIVSKSIYLELENVSTLNTSSVHKFSYEDTTEVGKILIYPNPALCDVSIRFNGPEWNQNYNREESWNLSLYSMDGVLLKTEKCQGHLGRISITSFPTGMYILTIQRGGLRKSYPLTKK